MDRTERIVPKFRKSPQAYRKYLQVVLFLPLNMPLLVKLLFIRLLGRFVLFLLPFLLECLPFDFLLNLLLNELQNVIFLRGEMINSGLFYSVQ